MPDFLRSVAAYYTEGAPDRPALHDVVFVTPNKRSAVFLKKHITRAMTATGRMPRLMVLRSLTDRLAGHPQAPHLQLVFMLYNAYRKVMVSRGRADGVREFDSFVFWGEMILSDFDEVDRSLVDAEKLFKNLKDVKDIQSDYLEPEIKELVHRVFGESRLTADYGEDSFWLHLADTPDAAGIKGRFVFLWQILGDIYKEFNLELISAQCSSNGSALRTAAAVSSDPAVPGADPDCHFAFVGFNDLCAAELAVFHNFARAGRASFFWDTPRGYMLSGSNADGAVRRLARLVKEFPQPDDFYCDDDTGITAPIEVFAVPSNIEQTKLAGHILEQWLRQGHIDAADAMNTAVVVPDAGLITPLMFSLPAQFDKINVSAGLPFRTTNFAGFLQSIVGMQLRSRRLRGSIHFFYEDVAAVLNHPYMRAIDNDTATAIIEHIGRNKMYNVDAVSLAADYPSLEVIFRSTGGGKGTVADTCAYLTDLIDWLCENITAVAEENGGEGKRRSENFEIKLLENFRRRTCAIADLSVKYGTAFNDRTFLLLFERILSREAITVEGNPLYGLQVLGVLETRALDFDNVIILSMNEGTYPRRQYSRTMIPASLRAAYELPDFDNAEATYAYCFFRLLSRAKRVALLYDSRAGGLGRGEMSRYIARLGYLSDNVTICRRNVAMGGETNGKRLISVEKTAGIRSHLDEFRKPGGPCLSATALKEYKHCPLAFYLKYVRGMRGSDEMVDYLTSAEAGTLIHNSIQRLFASLGTRCIDAPLLEQLLRPENTLIDDTVLEVLLENKRYARYDPEHLPAEARIAWKHFADMVRADIRAEADRYCAGGCCFQFDSNEKKVVQPWVISPELTVNWKMSIDRVDTLADGALRFIDFKSGSDEVKASNVESLFKCTKDSYRTDGIFQILAYCQTYRDTVNPAARIQPVIHQSAKLAAIPVITPISVRNTEVDFYEGDLASEFNQRLKELVTEIFNPEVPFAQCEKEDSCGYCDFRNMCGRFDN